MVKRAYIVISLCLLAGMLVPAVNPVATRASSVANLERNPLVRQAIEDLAQRESISPDAVEVVSVEEVVWPDTSMGCPHPDMRYAQVLQDGMRIILRADGREYAYHSGGQRAPFLCNRKGSLQKPPQIHHVPGPENPDH